MTKNLEDFVMPDRLERINKVVKQRTASLTLVLDHVHKFHNISAVIRSADAFGLSTLHLIGNSFEYAKSISLGAERWIDLVKHESAESAVNTLRDNNFKLVILEPQNSKRYPELPTSIPVFDLPFEDNLALVFGNEHRGVSPEIAQKADLQAHIPMLGFVESLNISVSAAICLFSSIFSEAKARRRPPTLSPENMAALREDYLKRSLNHGDKILSHIEAEG